MLRLLVRLWTASLVTTASLWLLAGSASALPTLAPVNTVAPLINGTFREGGQIHVTTGSWTSSARPLSYLYAFYLCNSGNPFPSDCAFLNSQSSPNYRLTGSHAGSTITATVTATDTDGLSTTAFTGSYPSSGTVQPVAPSNIEHPTIGGTAKDGRTLQVHAGAWRSADPLTFTYQWLDCGTTGTTCTAITDATSTTLQLTPTDIGHFIAALVTAMDDDLPAPFQQTTTAMASAPQRGPVKLPDPPINNVPPTISGTTQVGDVLTANPGGWLSADLAELAYSYQWKRCLAVGNHGGYACEDVPGATESTYTLTSDDLHRFIIVYVNATDPENQHPMIGRRSDTVGRVTSG
jgi:hypothetical protein